MQIDIPQEQLDRVQPMLDQFLTAFRSLEATIPLETESALTYEVQP